MSSNGQDRLVRLLAPVGLGRFVREFFGNRPLLLRGAANCVTDLLSLQRVAEAVVGREREQGRFLVAESNFDSEESVRAYLDRGQPVVWISAHSASAALDALVSEMSQAFCASVWPNIYSTGPARKPFDIHFDAHDVLVVQLEGAAPPSGMNVLEMVTRVNEAAGDNPRRSLAGFFFEKNPLTVQAHSGEGGGAQ